MWRKILLQWTNDKIHLHWDDSFREESDNAIFETIIILITGCNTTVTRFFQYPHLEIKNKIIRLPEEMFLHNRSINIPYLLIESVSQIESYSRRDDKAIEHVYVEQWYSKCVKQDDPFLYSVLNLLNLVNCMKSVLQD